MDEQTQRTFITCVLSLRLLAKMLGLLVSLPYRLESGASKEIITSQIEIRSSVSYTFNIDYIKYIIYNTKKLLFVGCTIVKFTNLPSECNNRRKNVFKYTLDSKVPSNDGYCVSSITILQTSLRITILYL